MLVKKLIQPRNKVTISPLPLHPARWRCVNPAMLFSDPDGAIAKLYTVNIDHSLQLSIRDAISAKGSSIRSQNPSPFQKNGSRRSAGAPQAPRDARIISGRRAQGRGQPGMVDISLESPQTQGVAKYKYGSVFTWPTETRTNHCPGKRSAVLETHLCLRILCEWESTRSLQLNPFSRPPRNMRLR